MEGGEGNMRFLFIAFLLLAGVHLYLAQRVQQCFRHAFPLGVSILLMAGLLTALVLGFAGSSRLLKAIGFYWMGAMVYLLLFFLLGDAALLLARLVHLRLPSFAVRITALILAIVTVIGGVIHADQIQTKTYDVSLAGHASLPETSIVLITDVHLGALRSEKRLEKIVEAVNAAQPDLVCIAGDFFDSHYAAIREPDQAMALMKQLNAPLGVYACPGNHDAGSSYTQMEDFLSACGVRLLKEEAIVIDDRLVLAGRLDSSPIGKQGGFSRGELTRVLADMPADLPVVVMDHNPANLSEYGSETDLLLCGHTHRGQIFPGSLITRQLYTVDYGCLAASASSPHVVVSSGAGAWGMPMRVGTDCEVVLIRLNP